MTGPILAAAVVTAAVLVLVRCARVAGRAGDLDRELDNDLVHLDDPGYVADLEHHPAVALRQH